MKTRTHSQESAFSLLEMMGVLAIMAIVAAIVTPNLARRVSRAAGEKEDERLTVISEGLLRSAKTCQFIAGPGSWVTNVAAMTGLPANEIRYVNAETENPRVYLIHPAFFPTNAVTSDPLWTQSSSGARSVENARLLILSSQKANLPLPVASGRASTSVAFDAIWDWNFDLATKAPPAGWPAIWNANGEYLHVQRVNLAPLFYRVTFSNMQFPAAYPAVQFGSGSRVTLNSTSAVDAYYIQSTYIRLFKDSTSGGGLDLGHSVEAAMNFLYESNRWRIP